MQDIEDPTLRDKVFCLPLISPREEIRSVVFPETGHIWFCDRVNGGYLADMTLAYRYRE